LNFERYEVRYVSVIVIGYKDKINVTGSFAANVCQANLRHCRPLFVCWKEETRRTGSNEPVFLKSDRTNHSWLTISLVQAANA
jgi:hypothetical protein